MTGPSVSPASPAAPVSHRPIFVVGANGSGSTLLRLMLDSHPNIAIPDETGFLRLAMAHEWVPYWVHGDKWHTRLGLSDEQRDRAVADFYAGLFASYAAERGKFRWGDKTPFHAWHLQRALRLYPEATVVAIVRHPAAVAGSMRRPVRRAIPSATGHWKRNTCQLLHEAQLLGDRFVMLRYEDLVTDPEPVMRALLDRLDEPWSDAVLAHHRVQGASEAVGFTRTDRAVDTKSLRDWESQLRGPARVQLIESTGALARFLGYDPELATPVAPLGDNGVLIDGAGIAARRARGKDDVDWTPPAPLRKDLPLRPQQPTAPGTGGNRAADREADRTLRDAFARKARDTMSPDARKRVHELRRSRPWLDRLFGPR